LLPVNGLSCTNDSGKELLFRKWLRKMEMPPQKIHAEIALQNASMQINV
jgi:hypothetical protein